MAAYGLASTFARSAAGFVLAMVFPPVVLLPILLILAAPAAVLVVGVRKRNLAMIVGPLLLVPIISVYLTASSWFQMNRMSMDVVALDMRSATIPRTSHDLIVLEYSRSTDCDELCQQILARTNYSVGVPGYAAEPVVYREISESQCKDTWYSARNIRFAGICATVEKVRIVDDALVIVTPGTFVYGGLTGWEVFRNLPGHEFSGNAYALVERVSGAPDSILSRWVAGEVAVWPFRSGMIGKNFSRKEFYSSALSLSFD